MQQLINTRLKETEPKWLHCPSLWISLWCLFGFCLNESFWGLENCNISSFAMYKSGHRLIKSTDVWENKTCFYFSVGLLKHWLCEAAFVHWWHWVHCECIEFLTSQSFTRWRLNFHWRHDLTVIVATRLRVNWNAALYRSACKTVYVVHTFRYNLMLTVFSLPTRICTAFSSWRSVRLRIVSHSSWRTVPMRAVKFSNIE